MMTPNAATCAPPIPFRSSDSAADLDGILLEAGADQSVHLARRPGSRLSSVAMVPVSSRGVAPGQLSALGSEPLGGPASAGPGATRCGLPVELAAVFPAPSPRMDTAGVFALVLSSNTFPWFGVYLSALPGFGTPALGFHSGRLCIRLRWVRWYKRLAADAERCYLGAVGLPISSARRAGRPAGGQRLPVGCVFGCVLAERAPSNSYFCNTYNRSGLGILHFQRPASFASGGALWVIRLSDRCPTDPACLRVRKAFSAVGRLGGSDSVERESSLLHPFEVLNQSRDFAGDSVSWDASSHGPVHGGPGDFPCTSGDCVLF